jgi:hypothetical protein
MLAHWYTLVLLHQPGPPAVPDDADRFDYSQLLRDPVHAPPRLARMAQHMQTLRDVRLRGQRKR